MDMVSLVLLAILGVIVLSLILGSFFTVSTAQVAVLTRFGKFLRVAEAGLNWKAPFLDSVSGIVSLRVNQIALTMETKTKDNVFVTIPISVQNRVRPERVYDAFYKLSDPVAQIKSYVEQVILGHVPSMTLDEVFASQSSIAAAAGSSVGVVARSGAPAGGAFAAADAAGCAAIGFDLRSAAAAGAVAAPAAASLWRRAARVLGRRPQGGSFRCQGSGRSLGADRHVRT